MREYGLQRAEDMVVFKRALKEERTIISVAFVKAVACPFSPGPGRRPDARLALLFANLPDIAEALGRGSVVVLEETRVRVRPLPVAGSGDDSGTPRWLFSGPSGGGKKAVAVVLFLPERVKTELLC